MGLVEGQGDAQLLDVPGNDSWGLTEAKVDGGPMFKRIQPHARGMGFLIIKRFSHITVAVDWPRSFEED